MLRQIRHSCNIQLRLWNQNQSFRNPPTFWQQNSTEKTSTWMLKNVHWAIPHELCHCHRGPWDLILKLAQPIKLSDSMGGGVKVVTDLTRVSPPGGGRLLPMSGSEHYVRTHIAEPSGFLLALKHCIRFVYHRPNTVSILVRLKIIRHTKFHYNLK